ncbi:MAG: hypothetical protein WCW67_07675 [Candidatus Margulisiibacteriota bacterium]|jgi:hypothetical protein
MITPVTNKSIIHLSQRALPALRGVVDISSFAIGKERLGPCLTALCQRQRIELNGIHLDRIAKIRLLGMQPSLETRAAGGETAETIFVSLELSAFLTNEEHLFILGDKENLAGIQKMFPAAVQQTALELPEMLTLSGKRKIMRGEVAVTLFKQVMAGYKIKGHNADKLREFLSDPANEGKTVTYVSLDDAMEFAKRLSELTGRKFLVQTEEEWQQAREQLTGDRVTWTVTPYMDKPDLNITCYLNVPDMQFASRPNVREGNMGIRLVEELPSETLPLPLSTPHLYDENGAIIQEEYDRRVARLEEMGVKLYRSYTVTEEGGYTDYERDQFVEQNMEVEKQDPYPDWLKNALVQNYDRIKGVFERHGRERLARMFESIGNPEIQTLLKKESADGTRSKVSSFIELMEYMGKSRHYLNFGAWVWNNREEIKNEGLGRLLFEVTNASPDELDKMLRGN